MPVLQIHQIEITSKCNLRCKYCVHPKMKRTKQHMDLETYKKALALAKYCVEHNAQKELNLCGIGESTMHPDFIEYMRLAREAMPTVVLVIASNGVKLKEEQVIAMKKYGMKLFISMHRPEVAGPAIELGRKHGVINGVSADPSVSAIDWAGQVDWHVSVENHSPCPWIGNQMVMVTAEGDLVSCCLDGDGLSALGTVNSDLNELEVTPYSLCSACHHTIPEFNVAQVAVGTA